MDNVQNLFTQHIPDFVDMRDGYPPSIPFKTTEGLLNLEVVQRYKNEHFHKWVMDGNTLMVVEDMGYKWWVVGFIKYPNAIKLPKWDGGRYKNDTNQDSQAP